MFALWTGFMKRLRVSPQAFVGHLLNEQNTLHFELSATPMDFRPRKGWLAEASGIPEHLFYFCKKGSIKAKVGGHNVDLKAGDAMWIGPDTSFRLESDQPIVTSLARFRLRLEKTSSVTFALKSDFLEAHDVHLNAAWLEGVRQESYLPAMHPSRSLRCALAGLLSMTFLQHPALHEQAAGFSIPEKLGFSTFNWHGGKEVKGMTGMDYRPHHLATGAVDVLHAALLNNHHGLSLDAPLTLFNAHMVVGKTTRLKC
jgi:hypothetical protein